MNQVLIEQKDVGERGMRGRLRVQLDLLGVSGVYSLNAQRYLLHKELFVNVSNIWK